MLEKNHKDLSLDIYSNNSNPDPPAREKNCPNSGYYAYIIDHSAEKERESLVFLRCKSWSCPFCAKQNSWELKQKAINAIDDYLQSIKVDGFRFQYYAKFLTLTVPGDEYRKKTAPDVAEEEMKKNWNRLRTAIKKKYGDFEYIWVNEKQKDGYPHLHILIMGKNIAPFEIYAYITELWCEKYKMGYAWINKVDGGTQKIAHYLSKYISKELENGKKHSRVYSMSKVFRSFFKLEKTKRIFTVTEFGRILYWEGKRRFEIMWTIREIIDIFDPDYEEDRPPKKAEYFGVHGKVGEQLYLNDNYK